MAFKVIRDDGAKWIPEAGGYVKDGKVVSTTPEYSGGSKISLKENEAAQKSSDRYVASKNPNQDEYLAYNRKVQAAADDYAARLNAKAKNPIGGITGANMNSAIRDPYTQTSLGVLGNNMYAGIRDNYFGVGSSVTPTTTTQKKTTKSQASPAINPYANMTPAQLENERAYLNSLIAGGGGNAVWAKKQMELLGEVAPVPTGEDTGGIMPGSLEWQAAGIGVAPSEIDPAYIRALEEGTVDQYFQNALALGDRLRAYGTPYVETVPEMPEFPMITEQDISRMAEDIMRANRGAIDADIRRIEDMYKERARQALVRQEQRGIFNSGFAETISRENDAAVNQAIADYLANARAQAVQQALQQAGIAVQQQGQRLSTGLGYAQLGESARQFGLSHAENARQFDANMQYNYASLAQQGMHFMAQLGFNYAQLEMQNKWQAQDAALGWASIANARNNIAAGIADADEERKFAATTYLAGILSNTEVAPEQKVEDFDMILNVYRSYLDDQTISALKAMRDQFATGAITEETIQRRVMPNLTLPSLVTGDSGRGL